MEQLTTKNVKTTKAKTNAGLQIEILDPSKDKETVVKAAKKVKVDDQNYAIVDIKGNQEQVSKDMLITIDRIEGDEFTFDQIYMTMVDGKLSIGAPLVEGKSVKAVKVRDFKGDKVINRTYKAKSRYRKVKGMRPFLSELKIISI